MTLGVLTEKGVFINKAPVISDMETNLFFFKKNKMNRRLAELIKQTSKLKILDEQKGRKAAKV